MASAAHLRAGLFVSFTLVLLMLHVCMFGYISLFECMYMHLYVTVCDEAGAIGEGEELLEIPCILGTGKIMDYWEIFSLSYLHLRPHPTGKPIPFHAQGYGMRSEEVIFGLWAQWCQPGERQS